MFAKISGWVARELKIEDTTFHFFPHIFLYIDLALVCVRTIIRSFHRVVIHVEIESDFFFLAKARTDTEKYKKRKAKKKCTRKAKAKKKKNSKIPYQYIHTLIWFFFFCINFMGLFLGLRNVPNRNNTKRNDMLSIIPHRQNILTYA